MYYPKSQIKTNLYTSGDEYVPTLGGDPYRGFYYKTSTGQYFTGRTPDDRPNIELSLIIQLPETTPDINNTSEILIYPDPDPVGITTPDGGEYSLGLTAEYFNLTNSQNSILTQIVPSYIAPTPTQQDYQIGEFRRYFCKKTNEILYLEINKATYDKLIVKDIQYLYSLYEPFNLPWKLTGTKEEVEKVNRNIVELTSERLRLPQLGRYLKDDYLKYYKFPNISNLYTSGSEFKTADGKNYIGPYHIHDSTGPMVGTTHTKEPHGLLFPINETIISEITTQYNSQPMMSLTSSITSTTPIFNTNTGGGSFSGGSGGGGY
jgi:hypothetical protein